MQSVAEAMDAAPLGGSPAAESRKRSREESKSNPRPPSSAPGPRRPTEEAGSNSSDSAGDQTYVDVDGAVSGPPTAHAEAKQPGSDGGSPQPTRASLPEGGSGSPQSVHGCRNGASSAPGLSGAAPGVAAGGYPVAPSLDQRRMKQSTLPMFGLLGDAASVRKELQDRDTQIDALNARLTQMEEELVRRDAAVAFTESQLEQLSDKLLHFQWVMREEMTKASRKSRAEARRILHQKHFELGQVALWPTNGREVWVEGNAIRELIPREAEVKLRRDEVEAEKRAAHSLVKQLTRQEREREDSSAGPPDSAAAAAATGGGGCDALVEAQKRLHLRSAELTSLTNQLNAFKQRREELEREKKAFIKEVRRISDEDASPFTTVDAIGPDRRYLLMDLLGKGGFSEVWRAFDLVDGQYVACKIHKIDRSLSQQVMENCRRHAERELTIMRQLNHPNLTRQYNVFPLSDTTFVSVMEHCHGVDLDTYLKRHGSLSEKDAQLVVRQMVCGLLYLASLENPVIHYDLKPANILLLQSDGTSVLEIKVTDFGLSKIVSAARDGPSDNPSIDLTSQGSGTYWYLPPECFETASTPRISNKVDVWSLGVIFYQMLFGRRPFAEGESQRRIWHERLIVTAARTLTFPENPKVSEESKDFIRHCLAFSVADRYDIFQASQHPYLSQVGRRTGAARAKVPATTTTAVDSRGECGGPSP